MNNFHEKALATSENNFGEILRATGPMAKANPFRFSTKYQDDETDLLYYGYRFYNVITGRWLSKDEITELGFRLLIMGKQPYRKPRSWAVSGDSAGSVLSKLFEEMPVSTHDSDAGIAEDAVDCNVYAFVGNDAVNFIDPYGNWRLNIHIPCPFLRCTWWCVIQGELTTTQMWNLAKNADKFIKCVTRSVTIMNMGCALGWHKAFATGCYSLATCIYLYSNEKVPPLEP